MTLVNYCGPFMIDYVCMIFRHWGGW